MDERWETLPVLHAWQIQCFVKLNDAFKRRLIYLLQTKYTTKDFQRKCHSLLHLKYGESQFLSTTILFKKILKLAKEAKIPISREEIERNIVEARDTRGTKPSGRKKPLSYKISFPHHFTPLEANVVARSVGDGHIHKSRFYFSWRQRDLEPMRSLIKDLFGSASEGKEFLTLPALLFKLFAATVKARASDLNSPLKILQGIEKMPFEHKLAALLGIIDDDGGESSSIIIFMDYRGKLVEAVAKLWDSLFGRDTRKEIVKYTNAVGRTTSIKGKKIIGKHPLYLFKAKQEGTIKLYQSATELLQKHGRLIFKKYEAVKKKYARATSDKATKCRVTRKNIIPKLLEAAKHSEVNADFVIKRFEVKRRRAYTILYRLAKEGKLRRVKIGCYMLN